jgi:tetratricopeptide (TPR) repeat protein
VGNPLACLTSLLLLAVSQPLPAAAADVASGTSEVPLNEPSAQKRLEAAIRAYEAGNVDQAIRGIAAAQRAGLIVSEAAKSHYYLGLAYRKQGKPDLAIAELTRALDEKRGLSDAHRADAKRNRLAALKEAGISKTDAVVESGAGKGDDAVSLAHRRIPNTPRTGAIPLPTVVSDWSSATKVAVAPPDRLAELATVYVTDMVVGGSQPYVATPEATVTAAVSSASSPLRAHSPTPNTVPETAPQPQVNAPAPAAVRLQVGEVASRNEAFALVVRLKSLRGSELAAQKLQIGEVVLDGGATVYRLYLGPYATAGEAQAACSSLHVSGYNCRLE